MKSLPQRGRIGIFNRSYYEETLIVRVHPEFLAKQKLPRELVTKKIWKERFRDIRNFESYLTRNGIVIRKFFLNVSRKEQKRRFLERIEEPKKNWKFSANDAKERASWTTTWLPMRTRSATPPRRSTLVRGSRRQQVVTRSWSRLRSSTRSPRSSTLSEGHQGEAAGACGREARIAGGK